MRQLLTLIVLAAAGYVGYTFYRDKFAPQTATEPSEEVAANSRASAPGTAPAPAFVSKIEVPPGPPGEKRLAPPGIFYMIDRVSIEHAAGIAAAIPGEQVKLMQRKGDGTMKVTSGKFEFDVKESQVTNDLDIARDVERKYALTHPLRQ